MITARRRPRVARPPARLLGVCLAVAVLGGLAGCSGDAEPPRAVPTSTAPTSAEPEPLATTATIGRVDGRLDRASRGRLLERVGPAVDSWIDGAYGGEYPRDDFSAAFTAFTEGARARAEDDLALVSHATLGDDVDDVRALRRRVRFDVLAVDGVAAGVTARVDLLWQLSGEATRRERVWGALYLTYGRSGGEPGWHVFGYDLRRGEV